MADTVEGVEPLFEAAASGSGGDAPAAPLVRLGSICDVANLQRIVEAGLVSVRPHPTDSLWILNYTNKAQFANVWDHELKLCRGLVVAGTAPTSPDSLVVARPFAKFANFSQHGPGTPFGELPTDLAFEVGEKVDGSLVVLYPASDGLALATRGTFTSAQALAATALLRTQYPEFAAPPGVTVLFEYVAPWNRIVVDYAGVEELVALAAIDIATGADVPLPPWLGRTAQSVPGFDSLTDVVRSVTTIEGAINAEGFVVRFLPETPGEPATRVKLKYADYLRLHRLVTGVSTLTIWEHLAAGRPVAELVEAVPDEFFAFVTETVDALSSARDQLVAAALSLAGDVRSLPRREAAEVITGQRDVPATLVFAGLDNKDVEALAWKFVRPEHAEPYQPNGTGSAAPAGM